MANQQSMLSANKAAKQWGKSRNTIKRDIENGTLSAAKGDNGGYLINVTELLRAYGEPAQGNTSKQPENNQAHAQIKAPSNPVQNNDLQSKVNLYAQEVRHLREKVANLEKQNEKTERKLEQKEQALSESIASERKLTQTVTALLTAPPTTKKRQWFWQRKKP